MAPEFSLEQQQKINRLMARAAWQRTSDIAVDTLVPKIVPSATSTKSDWVKFNVDVPSVFQLLNAGVDCTHLVYLTHSSPDDTMVTQGRCKRNEVGRGYPMAVGDYWVYVPLLTGDPAYFTARLSDASSELPSAASAIDSGGGSAGTVVVSTLNRGAFTTNQKNVVAAGTGVNLTALAIPPGFKLVIKGKPLNAGFIWVGNSKANAENHAVAYPLDAGEPLPMNITDASLVWIDADNAGEGVNYVVEQ